MRPQPRLRHSEAQFAKSPYAPILHCSRGSQACYSGISGCWVSWMLSASDPNSPLIAGFSKFYPLQTSGDLSPPSVRPKSMQEKAEITLGWVMGRWQSKVPHHLWHWSRMQGDTSHRCCLVALLPHSSPPQHVAFPSLMKSRIDRRVED